MKDTDEYDSTAANQQSDLNFKLGSLLERWLTRETDGCQFCNAPNPGHSPEDTAMEFCDTDCEKSHETVMDARLTLGKRDMEQRGYD